ncbi:MAG TPA: SMC-Scp complex subunit ScpB, partial [Sphaerochaeta sp.]|nr:SMC-Scp complex subunit ScpB [Sphaerochaeta sp.]
MATEQEQRFLSEDGRLVEVLLFLENEPVSLERLMKMTSLGEEQLLAAIEEVKGYYNRYMHGLDLVESHGSYHFLPSADLHEKLRSVYGRRVDRRLSRAALETLSIVAYSQPITRREIDNIRGVSSDSIIRLLREREYIKVVGRKDVIGHP